MVDIPANTTTTAAFEGSVAVMATFSGELETFGDTDWIKVTLQAGGQYMFSASAESAGVGAGDSILTLRDSNGAMITFNDNDFFSNSLLVYGAIAVTGTYFIEIASAGGLPANYSVSVTFNQSYSRVTTGDDTYSSSAGFFVFGDKGDDTITLTGTSFDAFGEQGDDNIHGNANVNHISGGLGNDTIDGSLGDDRLFGDAGLDFIDGSFGNDLIYGGPGSDRLVGGLDHDTIFTGEGADLSYGGPGNDIILVENAADQVYEDLGQGADTVVAYGSYALPAGEEIEYLQAEQPASTAALSLTGNEFANTITGNNGANVLNGGGATDTLRGLLGNDVYVLDNSSDTVIDTGGADTITSSVARSLLGYTSIENLALLGAANIAGTGNNLANTVSGNAGVNVLKGGVGNDSLRGLDGNDQIWGEVGRDLLTGGLGNDLFRYATIGHSPVGANADVIVDFDDFNDDRIDLSAVYGGVLAYRHNLAFTALGQVRINDIAGADVIVEVNTSGGLGADMQIRLTGTTLASMAANDFFL